MLEKKYFKRVSCRRETAERSERHRSGAAMTGAGALPGPFPLRLFPACLCGCEGSRKQPGRGESGRKGFTKAAPAGFPFSAPVYPPPFPARRALPSGSARAPQDGGREGARARHGGGGGGGGGRAGVCPRCSPSGLER